MTYHGRTFSLGWSMPVASIQLLGDFVVRTADGPVDLGRGAQRLLALLALRRHPQPRTAVAHALWPEASASRGVIRLAQAIRQLPEQLRGGVLVDADGRIGLDPMWTIDLDDALDAARRIHAGGPPVDLDLIVFRLDLLPGWFDRWLVDVQERYRRLRLSVLTRLARHHLAGGDAHTVVGIARELVEEDPLREDYQHLLVAGLARAGDPVEALEQYHRFRARLRLEWGAAPSGELVAAVSRTLHPSAAGRLLTG